MNDEQELVRLAKLGDSAAFSQLYQLHFRKILYHARIWAGDDLADDLVQEAFIQVFKNIDKFRGEAAFFSWLYRITMNCFLMKTRRRKHRPPEVSLDSPTDNVGESLEFASVDHQLESVGPRKDLEELIPFLQNNEQLVIRARYLEELTNEETASALGMTIGAVKAYASRGKAKLKLMFGEKTMNRRQRKAQLRADKLNAAAAREHIGSPRPTQVRSHRNGGGDSFKETDLGHYHHISGRDPRAPNQIFTSHGLLAKTPVVVRPPRTVVLPGKVFQYSEEMIAHQNYLLKLKQTGEDNMENNPGQPGSIESALAEARRKVQFYTKQAMEAEQESLRWNGVVEQLQGALDLVTGKRTPAPGSNGNGNSRGASHFPSGHWKNFMREKLTASPMARKELQDAMVTAGASVGGAYQTVHKAIHDELVMESDGKLHWMAEPRATG